MAKISELTELSTVAGGDLVPIVDDPAGTPVTKKITVTNLLAASVLPSHNHAASEITSGTLAHERGGLEFDASAVTTGDIIVGTSSGVMGLLNTGTDGQALIVQAGGSLDWEDVVGGALDTLEFKASVKAATTANITLSGEQTIDGVSCTSGDRVLVKDQSTGSENGIYVVDAYGWTRAVDYASGDAAAATFGHIQQGTVNADRKWLCENNAGSDTIGTHALTIVLDAGAGDVSGPGSSTDNAIVRWDGTGGDTVQNSGVTIDDSNTMFPINGTASVWAFQWGTSGADRMGIIGGTGSITIQTEVSGGGGESVIKIGDQGITSLADKCVMVGETKSQGSSGAAKTIDWGLGNIQTLTLTDNCTLTLTTPSESAGGGGTTGGRSAYLTLKLTQDGTGSRTVTWPSGVKWAGGTAPTLTTTAGASDIIRLIYDEGAGEYYADALLDVK